MSRVTTPANDRLGARRSGPIFVSLDARRQLTRHVMRLATIPAITAMLASHVREGTAPRATNFRHVDDDSLTGYHTYARQPL